MCVCVYGVHGPCSRDNAGHFTRVATAANARGDEIVRLLATSTAELRAQENLEDEEIQSAPTPAAAAAAVAATTTEGGEQNANADDEAVASGGLMVESPSSSSQQQQQQESEASAAAVTLDGEADVVIAEEAPAAAVAGSGAGATGAEAGDDPSQAQTQAPPVQRPTGEPANWFGEVGSIDLDDVNKMLVPMLFPHIFASVVSAAETQLLAGLPTRTALFHTTQVVVTV